MLSGNPDSFAIWCDSVESWSTDQFKNGCFGYFIAGNLIWTLKSTIGVDLHMLSQLYCMAHSVEDETLFHLPLHEAYAELHQRAFPSMETEVEHNDFTHLASAESLLDDGHCVFIIELGTQARIIYGLNENNGTVREVYLNRGEFQEVVNNFILNFGKLLP